MSHRLQSFVALSGIGVVLALAQPAVAATVSWSSSATTTAWSLGSNWTTGTAPVAGDDVVIFGGGTDPSNNSGYASTTINSLTLRPNPSTGDQTVTLSSALNVGSGGVTNLMTTGGRSLFLQSVTLAADQTWGGTRTIFVSGSVTGSKMTFNGSAIRFDANSPSWTGGIDVRMPLLAGGGFATGTITPFGTGTLTFINQRSDGLTSSTPGFGLAGASANVSLATAQILPNSIVLQDPTTGNYTIDQNNNSQAIGSGTSHFYVLAGNITGAVNAARTLSFTNTGFSTGGAATFVLAGANTYAAGTTISDTTVTLMVGSGGTAGTLGTGTVSNAGTLQFNRTDAFTVANVLTGAGRFQQIGTGTTTLSGANTFSGPLTISAGGLQIGNGGTAGTLGTGTVSNAGTLLFNRSDAITVSNTISGAGAIRQIGTGTTTLSGSNTYSGLTTVSSGALRVTNAAALGDASGGTTVTSGAALELSGHVSVGAESLGLAGSGIASGGALRSVSGTNSFAGPITFNAATRITADAGRLTLAGDASGAQTVTVGGAGDVTISGNLGLSSGSLVKEAGGTLTLSGSNTYSGLTTVSSGALRVTNAAALGDASGGTTVTSGAALELSGDVSVGAESLGLAGSGIASGGALRSVSGTNSFAGPITFNAATRITADAGRLTLAGDASGAQTVTVGGAGDVTISGNLGLSSGSLVKEAGGTLTLSGSSSFSGGTTFSGSTLVAASAGALGTGSVTGTGGGILAFNLPSNGTVANNLLLSGEGSGVVNHSTTAMVTLSGTITPSSCNFFTFSAQGASQAGFILSGSTSSPSTRLVVKDASLTVANSNAMTAANTFGNRVSLGDSGGSASTIYVTDGVTLGVTVIDANNNAITAPLALTLGMNAAGSGTFSGANGVAVDLHRMSTGGTGNTWSFTAPAGATVNISGQVVNTGGNFQAPLTKTGLGTVIYSGSNTYGGSTTVAAGVLQIGNGGTGGSIGSTSGVSVASGATLAFNRADDYGGAFDRTISGSGSVTIAGGTLSLSASNAYSGTTSLNAGVLNLASAGALGTGGNVVFGGGTLQYSGSNQVDYSNRIQGSSSAVVIDTNSQSITFASAIGSSNTAGLSKLGSGTLSLTGANTYGGTTTVNGGMLRISNNSSLGSAAAGTTISGSGSLGLDGSGGPLSVAENVTLGSVVSGALTNLSGTNTLSGAITLTSSLDYRVVSGRTVFTGGITTANNSELALNGAATIQTNPVSLGSGVLTFTSSGNSAANSIDVNVSGNAWGTTRINFGGYTRLGVNDALPTTAGLEFGWNVDANSSGTLDLNGKSQTVAFLRQTSIFPSMNGDQNITGGGSLTVNATSGTYEYHGRITDGATATALVKTGGGTQMLMNNTGTASNFTGGLTINAGTLLAGAANSLGGVSNPVTLNAGTLNLGGFSASLGMLTGSAGGVITTSAAAGTATLTTSFTGTSTFAGTIANNGSGIVALTKAGLGTLLVSGSNTYSGATIVSGGRLLINGQLTNSAVSVANGGTLGGSGTIFSAVSVASGGVLSPGNSPGLLSVGSLSLDAGSATLMEIDGLTRGTGYDAIDATSGLTYGGALQFAFGSSFADNSSFDLFNLTSGSPLGGFTSITATGSYGSLTFTNNAGVWSSGATSVAGQTMTFTESTGTLVIVPEPSAWMLAGLGVVVAGWFARRRQ